MQGEWHCVPEAPEVEGGGAVALGCFTLWLSSSMDSPKTSSRSSETIDL